MRTQSLASRLALAAMTLAGLACGIAPAPPIAITSPANGDRVSGMITLTAAATPATGIAQVEFVVDAVSVGIATTPPYSVAWDSSKFIGRNVKIVATARTTAGATSISPPVAVAIKSAGAPLDLGPESVYTLVNDGVIQRADELLQDIWDIGPRSPPVYLNPLTWTEDPFHDQYWRLIFYSLRPTSNLLWAYYTTGNTNYRDKLLDILASYAAYDKVRDFGDDPSDGGMGIVADDGGYQTFDEDYTTAFRAMILANSYCKLKRSDDLPSQLDADLLQSIVKLGNKLASPGGYTGSFGNHGFTSAASLLLLAENFPDLDLPGTTKPIAPTWQRIGNNELTNLIANAVDSDGVELEDSPFYHFYVMTFAVQITSWAQHWNVDLPDQFSRQSAAMSTYAAYILQPDLQVPLLGASVTTGLANLDPAVEAAVAARDPEFAYVASSGATGTEPTERTRLFPESGQCILRSGFGPSSEFAQQTFMTFNVGPWRSPHCHFDVLGLTYFSAGRRLLTDSGLFSYIPSPDHDYFYGTRAHNTVVVDGQDQSQGQLVTAGLSTSGPDWAYQSGSHGLYPGVTHQRAVLLLQRDLALVVDHLGSTASHDYTQTWHFAPDLGVTLSGLRADASDAVSGTPLLALLQGVGDGVTATTYSGATDPIQGWFSELYDVKVPNVALEYRATGQTASFVTLLASGPFASASPRVVVDQNDATAVRVRVCAGTVQELVEIDDLTGPNEAVRVSPATSGCE